MVSVWYDYKNFSINVTKIDAIYVNDDLSFNICWGGECERIVFDNKDAKISALISLKTQINEYYARIHQPDRPE